MKSTMRASMPLMTMLRHSLLAEAVPISVLTGLIFMPKFVELAPRPLRPSCRRSGSGPAIPGPLTGAMTANSTKFAPLREHDARPHSASWPGKRSSGRYRSGEAFR